MDSKLEAYRAQKRRDATLNSFKSTLYSMIPFQQQQQDTDDKSADVEQVRKHKIYWCYNEYIRTPHILFVCLLYIYRLMKNPKAPGKSVIRLRPLFSHHPRPKTRCRPYPSPIPMTMLPMRRPPPRRHQSSRAASSPISSISSTSCFGPLAGRSQFSCNSVWSICCCPASLACTLTRAHNPGRPRRSVRTVCSTKIAKASMERWTLSNSSGRFAMDRRMFVDDLGSGVERIRCGDACFPDLLIKMPCLRC